ncbi:MAG: RNA 2',3'-cyclic phosphodiesterase [Pseudomonadota bacterium]
MPRLFVATELSAEAQARASSLEEQLRRQLRRRARVRWTRPDGRHVTLCFLGLVADAAVDAVAKVMHDVAARHFGFQVAVHGLGAFPTARRARVLWLGVTDPAGALARLAADLQEGLREAGHEIDSREFKGHVTLGRVADRSGLDVDDEMELDQAEPISLQVDSIVLFESQLAPSGARYVRLRQARLADAG